jgi:hypothetical protein
MIVGILLMTMPARSKVGLLPYARFVRAMYQAWGVKVYAAVTALGLLLTTALLIWALVGGENGWTSGLLAFSLTATVMGFVGTAGAYPAMRRLWGTPDEQPDLVSTLLTRFGRWGAMSATCHLVAFISLLPA